MPANYSNDPFDFSVGTLWFADGDENYTKLGEAFEVKKIECEDISDKNSMFPSVSRRLEYNKSLSFTCTISNKARKKLVNLFEYGWKAKGPVRKKALFKTYFIH